MTSPDQISDRIRLAEAIGWKLRNIAKDDRFPMLRWIRPDGQIVVDFNPFTDANDDYAVLEWMRESENFVLQKRFFELLDQFHGLHQYKIGLFASMAGLALDYCSTETEDA